MERPAKRAHTSLWGDVASFLAADSEAASLSSCPDIDQLHAPLGASPPPPAALPEPPSWVESVQKAVRREEKVASDTLCALWREHFRAELSLSLDNALSLADLAWAASLPQDTDAPPQPLPVDASADTEALLLRLRRALRFDGHSDPHELQALQTLCRGTADPRVIATGSQLFFCLSLEREVARDAVPSPVLVRDLSAFWKHMRRTPIDATTAYETSQLCFHELAPLGLELVTARSVARQGLPLQDLLFEELGGVETLELEKLVMMDTDHILNTPTHPCHSLWQIALFHRYLRQMTGVAFLSRYVVLSHQIHNGTELLALRRHADGRPRRPLVVHAEHAWFVQLVPLVPRGAVHVADLTAPFVTYRTHDLGHALQVWMHTVRTQFDGTLEDGLSLADALKAYW